MRGIYKYFALLLAIALLMPVLAACGDDDDDDDAGQADEATPTEVVDEEPTPTEAEEMEATPTEAEEEEATPTEAEDGEATPTEAEEEATPTEAEEEATPTEAEEEATPTEGDGAMPGEGQTVRIGWIPWDEDIAATFLWQHILEERGYTVELTQLDAGTVFAGLSEGDIDVFLDVWLPTTHGEYWDRFGEDLEDLGIWYEPATLELAVPAYVEEVDSIPGLAENADMFNSEIVGIEPGAGMMGILREDVMPGYGLEDWTLIEGSTPAMLAELDRAINNEEPIVVTLWTPHWAYAEYDLKNLEDPDGLWGGDEELHVAGRSGFSDDFPTLAEWLSNFEMPDDALASLEAEINEAGEGNESEAVESWLENEDNQQLVDEWVGGGGS